MIEMNDTRIDQKKLFTGLFIYLCSFALTMFFGKVYHVSFYLGKLQVTSDTICGIINVLFIISCLIIVHSEPEKGLFLAIPLIIFAELPTINVIISKGNYLALPGVITGISSIPLLIIYARQLRSIYEEDRKLKVLSVTDPMTGLLNRRGLTKELNKLINKNQPFYLLFLDLDNFKIVNDNIGHKAGDELLTRLACQWQTLIDTDCVFARNGGDEFVIIVPDIPKYNITKFMTRCLAVLKDEFYFEEFDYNYYASASIGSVHYPDNGTNADDLLKFADIAMYSAKKAGGSCYAIYTQEMQDDFNATREIETAIRDGFTNDRFFCVFQPQYDIKTSKICGFEVLLRLKDADGNLVSPGKFIPVAEHSNLIFDIDNWVLSHAIIEGSKLLADCNEDVRISINVSARHILEKHFMEKLKNALSITAYDPNHLELEITEYCLVQNSAKAEKIIEEIRALGIKVALDDFGSGYASIKYLMQLPFDVLKIDKVFVDNIVTDANSHKFISMLITVGHTLGCTLIAEGVEHKEQLELLKTMGCDCIQGFLLGKPVDFDTAKQLLEAEH